MKIPRVDQLLDLSGKVALVTGSGRGIGSGIAVRLAEAGADVAVHYHSSKESAQHTARAVEDFGRRCLVIQEDLTTPNGAARAVEATVSSLGRLDILINNAGVYPSHPLDEMNFEEWKAVLDANLTAAFLCTRMAIQEMIRQKTGGAIVNISSIEAVNPAPGHTHDDAAKAGIEQFSRAAAFEMGVHGIRVNTVSPGLIWSERLEENWPEGVQRWLKRVPLGRLGYPEDVADACLFLVSPAARWISGANLVVDGGIMTCQVY